MRTQYTMNLVYNQASNDYSFKTCAAVILRQLAF